MPQANLNKVDGFSIEHDGHEIFYDGPLSMMVDTLRIVSEKNPGKKLVTRAFDSMGGLLATIKS